MEVADDYNTSAFQKCSDKHDRSCMVEGDRRIRSYLDAGGDNKNENGNPSGNKQIIATAKYPITFNNKLSKSISTVVLLKST